MQGAKIPPAFSAASASDISVKLKVPEKPLGFTPAPVPGPVQSSAQGAPASPPSGYQSASILFQNIASALGLPKDNLSLALVIFTRFFSLPPDPALIGSLRRELLSLRGASPALGPEAEAQALAAVIASDKGLSLSPNALERYAQYLLPPVPVDIDENPDQGKDNPQNRNENPVPEDVRRVAEEQAQGNEFLKILNSIRGKNRQYWMVLPFRINISGVELNIIIRLLRGEYISKAGNEFLVVDITGPKRRWRCLLNKAGDKIKTDIRVFPEYEGAALDDFKKKAEKFLGEGVFIHTGVEISSWMDDLCPEHLPSIDERV